MQLYNPHDARWTSPAKTAFSVNVVDAMVGFVRVTIEQGGLLFPDGALIAHAEIAEAAALPWTLAATPNARWNDEAETSFDADIVHEIYGPSRMTFSEGEALFAAGALLDHDDILPALGSVSGGAASLAAYAALVAAVKTAGPIDVEVTPSGGSATTISVELTRATLDLLTHLARAADAAPSGVFTWPRPAGALALPAAQALALVAAADAHALATQESLADVYADIASGAITTRAQIDAHDWPTSGGGGGVV